MGLNMTAKEHKRQVDPREPDYRREGIFQNHNCWTCKHGALPCRQGRPNQCSNPRARND